MYLDAAHSTSTQQEAEIATNRIPLDFSLQEAAHVAQCMIS